jgi:hypothetical protein
MNQRRLGSASLRPIIATFFVAFVANAIVVCKFFFAVPLVLAIAIALCLALAFLAARPEQPA